MKLSKDILEVRSRCARVPMSTQGNQKANIAMIRLMITLPPHPLFQVVNSGFQLVSLENAPEYSAALRWFLAW